MSLNQFDWGFEIVYCVILCCCIALLQWKKLSPVRSTYRAQLLASAVSPGPTAMRSTAVCFTNRAKHFAISLFHSMVIFRTLLVDWTTATLRWASICLKLGDLYFSELVSYKIMIRFLKWTFVKSVFRLNSENAFIPKRSGFVAERFIWQARFYYKVKTDAEAKSYKHFAAFNLLHECNSIGLRLPKKQKNKKMHFVRSDWVNLKDHKKYNPQIHY